MAVYQARFPLVSDEEISKTAASKNTFDVAISIRLFQLRLSDKSLWRNPPDVGVTSGQKPSTKIIYIVLQTSVGLF